MYTVIGKEEIKLETNYSKPFYYLIKLQYPGNVQLNPEPENRQERDGSSIGEQDNSLQKLKVVKPLEVYIKDSWLKLINTQSSFGIQQLR